MNRIVVFIHGFVGSPRQFDSLVKVVEHDVCVAIALTLPGHGTTTKAFAKSTMDDWQNYVNDEVKRLSSEYDRIFLVGHSMGCLLAINASIKYKEFVSGLFFISCPLKQRGISFDAIKARFIFVFYSKSNPIKAAYLKGAGVPLTIPMLWRSIKPAAELKKLIAFTNNNLHNVSAPVYAVFMESDEVISMDSLNMLKAGLTNTTLKYIVLPKALHAYFPPNEEIEVEEALRELIRLN
jgi:carboxylesterase